ncbi:adenylate and guanylate cyclase catalytic domain containing protein [Nitzschia inconspicua]|uniref:guanylate cyclase n=1 Tax=Nitzschia inconspicua TaxID=303405 RepID=A0A9K3KK03_9STRA|nr:adenylate and guanylate cyclase catalytic domain containing protein [Nitzschia inconspicua]
MLGWINDCIEKLVLHKFDLATWHAIKDKAGLSNYKDGGFLKLESYPLKTTTDLVQAASDLSGLTVPQVYEAFGEFFVPYIIGEGYHNLLCCQGSTLRDWMSNINAIHQHLQNTFPKSMTMPEFWCETNRDGSLRLFYFSARGSFLAPVATGIVREVAKFQFELDIIMTQVTTQGVDGSRFTSWIVETKDPEDMHKLTTKVGGKEDLQDDPTKFTMPLKCPMTGMEIDLNDVPGMVVTSRRESLHSVSTEMETEATEDEDGRTRSDLVLQESPRSGQCPYHEAQEEHDRLSTCSSFQSEHVKTDHRNLAFGRSTTVAPQVALEQGGLSASAVKTIFPYHVLIDSDFCIRQVGRELPKVLGASESKLCESEVDDIFEFVKPKPAKWTRSWLRKLQDQEFVLRCTLKSMPNDIVFKGTWMSSAGPNGVDALLVLCPDAKNLDELRQMNLTLSDLPAHGAYRDAVFLREHLSQQMNNALQMEKLSKRLQTEKMLLESLLPIHAAEELRRGQEVKPMIHNSVTMFFSDIVGFTNICKEISPCQVIDMLNELYGIMDFLAAKFHLFKVETIGDAYVCASGLPTSDENHAINVANFAIAVQHCCRKVLSPVDKQAIQLRIGIHSGEAASGIVGVTNPRYCVFGDTVNTTARHESTGEPGRVHCSRSTMMELKVKASSQFKISARGMVEMKGKGSVPTYWIDSTDKNKYTSPNALLVLEEEIAKNALSSKKADSEEKETTLQKQMIDSEEVGDESARTMTHGSIAKDFVGGDTSDTLQTDDCTSNESDISRLKCKTIESLNKAICIVNRSEKNGVVAASTCSSSVDSTSSPLSRSDAIALVARSRKRRIELAMQQTKVILAAKVKM